MVDIRPRFPDCVDGPLFPENYLNCTNSSRAVRPRCWMQPDGQSAKPVILWQSCPSRSDSDW